MQNVKMFFQTKIFVDLCCCRIFSAIDIFAVDFAVDIFSSRDFYSSNFCISINCRRSFGFDVLLSKLLPITLIPII